MTAAVFLAATMALAWLIVAAARRHLGTRVGRIVLPVLGGWLLYVGALSASGVVGNPALRPPGIAWIGVPMVAFVALFAARSRRGGEVARTLPIDLLIGAQVFRVGVELGLHHLWQQGLVPRLMTYEGGNVDLFVGLSAPLVAWAVWTGVLGRRAAIAWNALGLLSLVNIIVRSALTAPGPLHLLASDVPNLALGTFPYTVVAGFFAPLAVTLHVLAIRHLRARSAVDDGPWVALAQFGRQGAARAQR